MNTSHCFKGIFVTGFVTITALSHIGCELFEDQSTAPVLQEVTSYRVEKEAKPHINQLTCNSVYSLSQLFLLQYPQNSEEEPQLDNSMSEAIFQHFISSLDPHRIAFHQEHLDDLRDLYEHSIDDYLAQKDCSFIQNITDTWKQHATASYDVLLEKTTGGLQIDPKNTFDFRMRKSLGISTSQPILENSQELDSHQKAYLEANIYANAHMFSLKGDNTSLRKRLKNHFGTQRDSILALSPSQAYGLFLNAFLKALDGHSSFKQTLDFEKSYLALTSQLGSIDAKLEDMNGEVIVKELTHEGSSESHSKNQESQLQVGDSIIAIKPYSNYSTQVSLKHTTPQNFMDHFLGQANSSLQVTLLRKSKKMAAGAVAVSASDTTTKNSSTSNTPLTIELKRSYLPERNYQVSAEILTHTALGKEDTTKEEISTTTRSHQSLKAAFIRIPAFYATTSHTSHKDVVESVSEWLNTFSKENINFLILDLRGVSKGFIDKASELAQLFIPTSTPFQILGEYAALKSRSLKKSATSVQQEKLPLMVLVDGMTAGPAEAFAQAIQTHGRGFLVGDHYTAGVSNVTFHSRLSDLLDPNYTYASHLGGVEVTTGRFYGTNGVSIEGDGLGSDISVATPMAPFSLLLMHKNPYFLSDDSIINATKTLNLPFRDPTLMRRLADKSKKRIEKQNFSSKLATFNDAWQKTLEILLNLEFDAEEEATELNPFELVDRNLSEEYKTLRNYQKHILSGKQPPRKDDFLLLESLHIARDYLELHQSTKAAEPTETGKKNTDTNASESKTQNPTSSSEETL